MARIPMMACNNLQQQKDDPREARSKHANLPIKPPTFFNTRFSLDAKQPSPAVIPHTQTYPTATSFTHVHGCAHTRAHTHTCIRNTRCWADGWMVADGFRVCAHINGALRLSLELKVPLRPTRSAHTSTATACNTHTHTTLVCVHTFKISSHNAKHTHTHTNHSIGECTMLDECKLNNKHATQK